MAFAPPTRYPYAARAVTTPTAPVDTAPPPPASPDVAGRSRLAAVTVVVATVGVVIALIGVVWGTRPLQTPTQDCGTAFSFLLDGRLNVFVDPNDPPSGVTPADAEANNQEPCQERAANRARPAGALAVGGTLLATAAAAVDVSARTVRWYRRDRMPPVDGRRGI